MRKQIGYIAIQLKTELSQDLWVLFFLEVNSNMEKLFDIVPTKKANRKKKYPYNVEYPDGLAVPVPSQYDFSDSTYIRTKG